jgi:hypothetical protein
MIKRSYTGVMSGEQHAKSAGLASGAGRKCLMSRCDPGVLYGNTPTFENVLQTLGDLEKRINAAPKTREEKK